MNQYEYVRGRPVVAVDPDGKWTRVGGKGHTWCAQSGDTLESLAAKQEYGGEKKNWSCLWPTADTKDNGYLSKSVKPGDKYSAENLVTPNRSGTIVKYIVARSHLDDFRSVFGENIVYIEANRVAEMIQLISGQGSRPIKYMLLAGHSDGVSISGYSKVNGLKVWNDFNPSDIINLKQQPSFQRAARRQGPPRCWFTRDAKVVLAGCNTKGVSYDFSENILRKGAKVWGTNRAAYWSDGKVGWKDNFDMIAGESQKEVIRWQRDWTTSPVWGGGYSGEL